MANLKKQHLVDEFTRDDRYLRHLIFVEEVKRFMLYTPEQGYYKLLTTDEMQRIVTDFVWEREKDIGKGLIGDLIYLIQMRCYKRLDELPNDYIALEDRALNLASLDLEPLTPEKVTFHKIPCSQQEMESCQPKRFKKFLTEVLIDDDGKFDMQLHDLMQEVFGFVLYNYMTPEKFFFLHGTGANGKSVILDILAQLVGPEYTLSLSIQDITSDKFGASALVGKKLNIVKEEESQYVRIDKLKTIVSGETISAQEKFGQRFEMKSKCKFIFATNNLPKFRQIGYAEKRRITIIPFKKKLKPEEFDHFLAKNIIQNEMPGVLRWAIEGGKRLLKNNFVFSSSLSADKELRDFEQEVSSAVAFIREHYTLDESKTNFIPNTDLYAHYKAWCLDTGRKSMQDANFGKEITAELNIDSTRVTHEGTRTMGRYLNLIV